MAAARRGGNCDRTAFRKCAGAADGAGGDAQTPTSYLRLLVLLVVARIVVLKLAKHRGDRRSEEF
jgi:hypothetical protein